jgi:hypothetical protein
MDAFQTHDALEALVILRLRERDGANAPQALDQTKAALDAVVADAQAGVPEPPIQPDDFEFVPPVKAQAALQRLREMNADADAVMAAQVKERDERRARADGEAWADRQRQNATARLQALNDKFAALRLETVECEIPVAEAVANPT